MKGMDMDKKLWVTEYSTEQRQFHIDYLNRSLRMNRTAIASGVRTSFVPIGVFETAEAANECARLWEVRLKSQQRGKGRK